jgi:hypothetical protein
MSKSARDRELANLEHQAGRLLSAFEFLMAPPEKLAALWTDQGSFKAYVDRKLPEWNALKAQTLAAYYNLSPKTRPTAGSDDWDCGRLLSPPED